MKLSDLPPDVVATFRALREDATRSKHTTTTIWLNMPDPLRWLVESGNAQFAAPEFTDEQCATWLESHWPQIAHAIKEHK